MGVSTRGVPGKYLREGVRRLPILQGTISWHAWLTRRVDRTLSPTSSAEGSPSLDETMEAPPTYLEAKHRGWRVNRALEVRTKKGLGCGLGRIVDWGQKITKQNVPT